MAKCKQKGLARFGKMVSMEEMDQMACFHAVHLYESMRPQHDQIEDKALFLDLKLHLIGATNEAIDI